MPDGNPTSLLAPISHDVSLPASSLDRVRIDLNLASSLLMQV
jgi:hypothetical protein